MKKFLALFMIIMVVVTMCTINVYAIGDIFSGADDFIHAGDPQVDESTLIALITYLTNIGLVIGVIIAIIAGIIIAIKFMTDGANGKAELKTALTPYIFGVAILFGAFGIWKIVILLFQNVFA